MIFLSKENGSCMTVWKKPKMTPPSYGALAGVCITGELHITISTPLTVDSQVFSASLGSYYTFSTINSQLSGVQSITGELLHVIHHWQSTPRCSVHYWGVITLSPPLTVNSQVFSVSLGSYYTFSTIDSQLPGVQCITRGAVSNLNSIKTKPGLLERKFETMKAFVRLSSYFWTKIS